MNAVLSLTPSLEAGREDAAILRTVTYAALFQAPLRLDDLHRRLMGVLLDPATLAERLSRPFLRERLEVRDGWVFPRGHAEWMLLRRARQAHTDGLIARHDRALRLLARLPFVRLVALSGGCAYANATDDDVDVFLLVARGRAWLATAVVTLLSRLLGVRRSLCVNYVVDEEAIALPETDLFTAMEIVGLRPLAGREAYRRFISANAWAEPRFPNFFARIERDAEAVPEIGRSRLERFLERGPAQALEPLVRLVLGWHLRRKGRGHAGFVISPHRLKLHLLDHGPHVMGLFESALRVDAVRQEPAC